jgi:hypothetical protein
LDNGYPKHKFIEYPYYPNLSEPESFVDVEILYEAVYSDDDFKIVIPMVSPGVLQELNLYFVIATHEIIPYDDDLYSLFTCQSTKEYLSKFIVFSDNGLHIFKYFEV